MQDYQQSEPLDEIPGDLAAPEEPAEVAEPAPIETDPADAEIPEEPSETAKKHHHRALFWWMGALLAFAAVVVILIKVLNVQIEWQSGRLVVSLFGAESAYVEDAVTDAEEPKTEDAEKTTMPRAATGTGVTLPLTESAGQPLTLQELYRAASPGAVSILSDAADGSLGTGSGIVMTSDGYIITNHHVISGAVSVSVETGDGTSYDAELVGSDEFSDLAVLKIDASGLHPAEFLSSAQLQVGDDVVAIGDPLGIELRGTMTNGIISAINRDIVVQERTMTLLQTNAALNSGNSGGPLLNMAGQVIGINTMKISSSYVSVEGLGFAIPMDVAKPIIDELIANGFVAGRPALGIMCTTVAAKTSAFYSIPAGVYINEVKPHTDAAQKGLQVGDIIIAIEGKTVTSTGELNTIKNDFRAGDVVGLTVWRNGEIFDVGVQLMDKAG